MKVSVQIGSSKGQISGHSICLCSQTHAHNDSAMMQVWQMLHRCGWCPVGRSISRRVKKRSKATSAWHSEDMGSSLAKSAEYRPVVFEVSGGFSNKVDHVS